ncbi:nicotinate phosphoribosyltransferase isoform X4 [Drosophila sechellia]|uniref:nicotinate phosphoribosyltransferase isoform X4 n=1 Tax=Drosophila sechellia TaxID=7238 RepID=UPI0013DDCD6D|nr:nicotinate phosphoribosyltransferase isoform X4 [Drosophila sechellia]
MEENNETRTLSGFDGTSNVLAGKLFNIPVKGTHAHAYITSFSSIGELKTRLIKHKQTGILEDLLEHAVRHRALLSHLLDVSTEESSEGELAAMVSYAIAFPDGFMALVDTYDVKSRETEQANTEPKLINDIKSENSPPKPKTSPSTNGHQNGQAAGHVNGHKTNGHQNGVAQNNGSRSPKDTDIQDTKIPSTTTTKTTATATGTLKTTTVSNGTAYLPKYVEKSFRSGLLNFSAVALALNDLGYHALGIRIDSGDLAYLSCLARETFEKVAERFKVPWFNKLTIVASNDINEDTILSLNEQGHKIDCFGIGTHLVTCQRQPALGCVYKLVEINGQPRIKLSQDVEKVTMPGNKNAYRLYSADGHALIDLLQKVSEPPPAVGQKVLCRHPFQESKRAYVIPSHVESLYKVYWKSGKICQQLPTLEQVREKVQISLKTLRNDHKRTLNPTPYKVAVSDNLYNFIHDLWLQNAPIGELS